MTLENVYALAGVTHIRALNRVYTKEDQRLMKLDAWDYDNPNLLTNRIKEALEAVDPDTLTREEKEWRWEILWFWHHHAISCAAWKKRDRAAARRYAAMALLRQGGCHPNRITRLLYLLLHDRVEEAIGWAAGISNDRETAISLIDEYRQGGF